MGAITKLFDFRREVKDAPEKRASYASDVGNLRESEWADRFWKGSLDTVGGERVDEQSALTIPAFYQGVRLRALAKSVVPLKLYKKRKGGGADVVEKDARHKIISRNWNSMMPGIQARRVLSYNEDFYGNSFTFLDWSRDGQLKQMIPVWSKRIELQYDEKGELYYFITSKQGKREAIPPEFIMHQPSGITTDGVIGTSPIWYAANALSNALAADKQAGSYFRNNAKLGGVLIHPKTLSQNAVAKLEEDFEKKRKGADNAYKTLILEEGMQFQKMTMDATEIELMTSRQWTVPEVGRILNIPPNCLFDYGRATWGNAEDMRLQLMVLSLLPEFEMSEQYMNMKLLTEREQDQGYYFKHSVQGLLRADSKSRWATYKIAREIGVMSPDEVRDLEELNPLPDDQGKIWTSQMNNESLKDQKERNTEEADDAPPAKDGDEGDEAKPKKQQKKKAVRSENLRMAFSEIFIDKVESVVRRETSFLSKHVKRKADERQRTADEFFQAHSAYMVEILTPTIRAWCRAVDADAIQQRQLIVVLEDWSTVMVATASAEIEGVNNEERANEVTAEWRRARATTQAAALLDEIERVTQ